IADFLAREHLKFIVVEDHTVVYSPEYSSHDTTFENLGNYFPEADEETRRDYVEKNKHPLPFSYSFNIPVKYGFITHEERENDYDRVTSHRTKGTFYDQYPDADGVL